MLNKVLKNNKGYMLIELILASIIAFSIAYFAIDITIKVKEKNDDVLVSTLASTDQTIITNLLMKEINQNYEKFNCSLIKKENNTIKYNNDIIYIVNDYALLGNINCKLDTSNEKAKIIKINIPLTVNQIPNKNFNVNINYIYNTKKINSITNTCTDGSNVEAPRLGNALIPITLSNNGVATVADASIDKWYAYCAKLWANAVLVKENGTKTRSYYKSHPGETINSSDILAYYVWIPRYKYTFKNANGNPETIDVAFENINVGKSTGSAKGINQYRTHPAFTFSGKEYAGVWIAKYEVSITSGNLNTCANESCAAADNIRFLPNTTSINKAKVSKLFYGIRSMQRSGNPFGLAATSANLDSHMIKNVEWGVAAYLSHSAYGGGNVNSTTGNITGIYDMNGKNWECVMGYLNGDKGTSGFSSMPNAKYFDAYTYDTNKFSDSTYNTDGTKHKNVLLNYFCTNNQCLGHSLNETAGWYNGRIRILDHEFQWYERGGSHNGGVNIFNIGRTPGCGDSYNNTTRSVLIVG